MLAVFKRKEELPFPYDEPHSFRRDSDYAEFLRRHCRPQRRSLVSRLLARFKRKQNNHNYLWHMDWMTNVIFWSEQRYRDRENRQRIRWTRNEADAAAVQGPLIEARVEDCSDRLLRAAVARWSEALSVTVERVTLEEINRVFLADAAMCRAMLAIESSAVLSLEYSRYSEEKLVSSFEKMRELSRSPIGFHQATILPLKLAVTIYGAALKALPIAEALEKSTQLDNAFPKVAAPAHSRRF